MRSFARSRNQRIIMGRLLRAQEGVSEIPMAKPAKDRMSSSGLQEVEFPRA